ncbi:MAG: hypothetical protein P8P99_03320 [Maricaulis sp.]|nr:hypothetical protein [Maricaulis sp.]
MLWWPLSNTVRRRLRASGIALGVHGVFGLTAYFAHSEYFEKLPEIPKSVDVVFLNPPEPELTPPPEPEIEPEIAPPAPAVPPPPPRDTPVVPVPTEAPPAGPVSSEEDEEEAPPQMTNLERLQSYEVQPFFIAPPPGRTAELLQSVFCATTPDSSRDAAECDYSDYDPTALLQYAETRDLGALNAAFGLDLTPNQIRILNGIAAHELAGQATLDTSARPTSSADEMRDTLPPQVVDPSFGD